MNTNIFINGKSIGCNMTLITLTSLYIHNAKASFTLSRISVPVALRCGHQGPPGPHRSDAGEHRFESGYTVLNRRSPGNGPGCFNIFKTTGAHRGAKQRRLSPGHHRNSSDMNRISTVRPPGDTVANRHELCPWRGYGDSRLSHGVSRRRAGVAPTLAGRTTVCNGGSR